MSCLGDFCTFTSCLPVQNASSCPLEKNRQAKMSITSNVSSPCDLFRGADSCKELRPQKTSDGDQSVACLLRLCQSVLVISARSQEDLPLRVVLVPVEEMCRTTRGKGVVTSKWGGHPFKILIVKNVAPRSLPRCRSLQVSTLSRV